MIVEFPVSPVSRKILVAEYGHEPIKLKAHDIIFQKLFYKHPRFRSNVSKLKEEMTSYVRFDLHSQFVNSIKGTGYQVGYHLHCYHLDLMMRYTHTATLVKIPAARAIQMFYAQYDITEDDYQYEAAYKRWQRYGLKKTKNNISYFNNKIRQIVLPDSQVIKLHIPPSDSYLDRTIVHFCASHYSLFTCTKNNFHSSIFKQLCVYTYSTVGHRAAEEIARHMNISIPNVYYCIQKYKQLILINDAYDVARKASEATFDSKTA